MAENLFLKRVASLMSRFKFNSELGYSSWEMISIETPDSPICLKPHFLVPHFGDHAESFSLVNRT